LVRIILAVLLVILAATFSTLNREEIALRYFFGWSTAPFPLFILVLASLVIGMILGFSVDWGERWKLRAKARELRNRVKELRKEIESLTAERAAPEPPAIPPQASKTTPG
jgi:lipopolysaccharide assembly protein A